MARLYGKTKNKYSTSSSIEFKEIISERARDDGKYRKMHSHHPTTMVKVVSKNFKAIFVNRLTNFVEMPKMK